jgi:tetratricopeptide (TPR) repeat protein
MRDLEGDDRKRLSEDMQSWARDMASQESIDGGAAVALPPVRGQSSQATSSTGVSKEKKKASKAISGGDFEAWNKFDVDKALADTDADTGFIAEKTVINSTSLHLPSSIVADVPADGPARRALAMREKDKGNESFRAGDHEEAAVYYTRSLSVEELAATRNNRALVYIKLSKYKPALEDTACVLAIEPQNVKALVRKASALVGLGNRAEAYVAAKQALKLQPNHKEAHKIATDCATAIAAPKKKRMVIEDVDEVDGTATITATKSQARRIVIEEDSEDESDDNDDAVAAFTTAAPESCCVPVDQIDTRIDRAETGATTAAVAAPRALPTAVVEGPPTPPAVLRLKEEGNKAFRAGQYAGAVETYSRALEALRTEKSRSVEVEAALLSNRAACHLKDGSCRAAVIDCTAGLALNTSVSAKLLLRRASAYEASEKYAEGYADFEGAFRAHPDSQVAQSGLNRCSYALRQLHGLGWRKAVEAVAPRPAVFHTPQATSTPAAMVPQQTAPTSAAEPSDVIIEYETQKTKGNELTKAGKFAEAIVCYDHCVELNSTASAALNNRALCNLRLGNWSAATRDTSAVLAIEPKNTKALLRRAKGLAGLGEFAAAEAAATDCLQIQPSNEACAELLESLKAEVARAAAMVKRAEEDPELAELNARRNKLEGERRAAQAALKAMHGKVETVRGQVSKLQGSMAEKEKILDEAQETIRNSVGDVVDDVRKQAEAEGDTTLEAEAAAAKIRVVATLAADRKKRATKAAQAATPTKASPTNVATTGTPWTPTTFMKQLAQKRKEPKALCNMLETVDGRQLPKLFSNRLEAGDITATFAALQHSTNADQMYSVLHGLAQVRRFDMVAMFLEEKDWEMVDPVFDRVKAAAAAGSITHGVTVAVVEDLRTHFH